MAYLKVEHVYANNKATRASLKLKIYVSADGEFYCHVPDEYIIAAKGVFGRYISTNPDKGKIKLEADSLDQLTQNATSMLVNHINPEVTEEHVILYNIESHVSFATDDEGNIYPNCGYEGANRRHDESNRFGDHHASNAARGGYSLTIGAMAMTKTTYKFGESKKVEYDTYYKGESHLGNENPAQILNSWNSFRLPDDAKEMPYTDEAALFFHGLMMGMAKLSVMIQNNTFDQSKLLELIESGNNSLLLPKL